MKDEMIQEFAGKYIITHLYGVDIKSISELAAELDMTEREVLNKKIDELRKIQWIADVNGKPKEDLAAEYEIPVETIEYLSVIIGAELQYRDIVNSLSYTN